MVLRLSKIYRRSALGPLPRIIGSLVEQSGLQTRQKLT